MDSPTPSIRPTKDEKPGDGDAAGHNASIIEIPLAEQTMFKRVLHRVKGVTGLETRGIERVPDDLRYPRNTARSYLEMFLVWFSINCTANNMTVGILGPIAFGLSFTDAALCCVFGTMVGSAFTGYISSYGPVTGLRTLVIARYTMGYWPSRICVVLNLVIEIGYGLVDCLVGGLILSAVNGQGMSVIVGIVVSSIITWVVATLGIKWFRAIERYVWMPTVLLLFIFIGVAGPNFDIHTSSTGSTAVVAGHRLSYFFLCASGPLGWAPASADFYSYYPSNTPRYMTAAMAAAGITAGKLLIEILGIGLASGLGNVPAWAEAFDHSAGHLIAESYAPLGNFGKFCAVILAICVSANNIPGTYAAGLNFQMLGRPFAKIPRPVWSTVAVVIYTVCAIAGREQLFSIFLNFLSLVGYWVILWIIMTLEEEFIFRRTRGSDWDAWDDADYLPAGFAALASFLIGWAGAILCMSQTYYTGSIAKLVGGGADLGLPVSMSWTALVYPPLRYLELKYMRK
ncbi:unnamed protein product [Clonostachys rosea]|uniref:Nucleoside transporter n=1 Tax=Bionectria ochroleuca TaxID=29856 RepID=A0ABY6TQY8_BIOOC|nr:unnamed protein product [Clonostachys rosea]